MPIKLIATDLDGTFLARGDEIPPANLAAVRAALDAGMLFVAISGRSAENVSLLLAENGLSASPVVGCNGAQLWASAFGAPLETRHMAPSSAATVLDILMRAKLPFWCYGEKKMAHRQGWGIDSPFLARMRRAGVEITDDASAFADLVERGVYKFTCRVEPGLEAAFEATRDACGAVSGAEVTSSWVTNFEVMPRGVNKGEALARLCAKLNVSREEVMAFGDNDNDCPMLRWAGLPVAVANATPAVHALKTLVTAPCFEGGVGLAIKKYALRRNF